MWNEQHLRELRRRERRRERWRALKPHLPWIAVAILIAALLTFHVVSDHGWRGAPARPLLGVVP